MTLEFCLGPRLRLSELVLGANSPFDGSPFLRTSNAYFVHGAILLGLIEPQAVPLRVVDINVAAVLIRLLEPNHKVPPPSATIRHIRP